MSGLNTQNLRIPKTIKLFIGGEFPRTESGRSLPVHRFQSQELYAHICRASRKDFRNAVTAALSAQHSWESRSAYNRGQILYRIAEMIEAKRDEFVETMVATLGLSTEKAHHEVDGAVEAFVYYAGFSDKYQTMVGSVNPVSGPHHNFTTCEPVGVVGLLCDDQFSFLRWSASIAAIIVSGNTTVALLGEEGAAILASLAEAFATSDLPKGVVNLLSGSTTELAGQFSSHMELNSLSDQRSHDTGIADLQKSASENMKRVVRKVESPLSLGHLTSYLEYKTVWHPVGY